MKRNLDATIENTQEIRDKLAAEIERTGVGPDKFFKMVKEPPEKFSVSTFTTWRNGKAQNLRKSTLHAVLRAYATFPNANVPISEEIKQLIQSEIERTSVTSAAIIADHPDKPKELSLKHVSLVITGSANTSQEAYWEFIINRYASLPNIETHFIEDLAALNQELERTGLTLSNLSRVIKRKTSTEYETKYLKAIFAGRVPRVPVKEWEDIVTVLSSHPNASQKTGGLRLGYIEITTQLSKTLQGELKRTDPNIKLIASGHDTLTANKISLLSTNKILSIRENEWDYLLAYLKTLPDKQEVINPKEYRTNYNGGFPDVDPPKTKHITNRTGLSPVTKTFILEITKHRERSGVSIACILKRPSAPKELKSYTISQWLRGAIKSGNPELMNWLLKEYKDLPDALNGRSN